VPTPAEGTSTRVEAFLRARARIRRRCLRPPAAGRILKEAGREAVVESAAPCVESSVTRGGGCARGGRATMASTTRGLVGTATVPRRLTVDAPLDCTIRAAGALGARWSDRLGGLRVRAAGDDSGDPVTELRGSLLDQAALLGVPGTLYELGLPLLSVAGRAAQQPPGAGAGAPPPPRPGDAGLRRAPHRRRQAPEGDPPLPGPRRRPPAVPPTGGAGTHPSRARQAIGASLVTACSGIPGGAGGRSPRGGDSLTWRRCGSPPPASRSGRESASPWRRNTPVAPGHCSRPLRARTRPPLLAVSTPAASKRAPRVSTA
jgi:hypothetical protein